MVEALEHSFSIDARPITYTVSDRTEVSELIPTFDPWIIFADPWSPEVFSTSLKICLLATFVFISCGLAGNYLILRRMALVGDAMSHSVLPGIVIAFLIAHGNSFWVMIGAILTGLLTTVLIEWLHTSSRVKQDVAIGITFTTLFAVGVILVNLFGKNLHIDLDCVLWGDVEQVAMVAAAVPSKLIQAGVIAIFTILLVGLFYKELLVTSFDPTLARSIGIPAKIIHYGLMAWLSVVVVSAFEAVGSIMVVAMLILPGATGLLLSEKLSNVLIWSVGHAILSAFGGYHVALALNCSVSAAMVTTGFGLLILAWLFGPTQGLVSQFIARAILRQNTREALAER